MSNKLSLKFRLEENTLRKFYLISPDGFSIVQDKSFTNTMKAYDYYKDWMKRYESQGYYSSTDHGKISIEDLHFYVEIFDKPYKF